MIFQVPAALQTWAMGEDSHHQGPPSCDIAALPRNVAVAILARAYFYSDTDELNVSQLAQRDPFRTCFPLVSKRWASLLTTPEAVQLLWRRVSISGATIADGFSPSRFKAYWAKANRAAHIHELHVTVNTRALQGSDHLQPFLDALAELIVSATSLKTLNLSDDIPVGRMFASVSDRLPSLTSLQSICLEGGGHDTWELVALVNELPKLPCLECLQIKFPK